MNPRIARLMPLPLTALALALLAALGKLARWAERRTDEAWERAEGEK